MKDRMRAGLLLLGLGVLLLVSVHTPRHGNGGGVKTIEAAPPPLGVPSAKAVAAWHKLGHGTRVREFVLSGVEGGFAPHGKNSSVAVIVAAVLGTDSTAATSIASLAGQPQVGEVLVVADVSTREAADRVKGIVRRLATQPAEVTSQGKAADVDSLSMKDVEELCTIKIHKAATIRILLRNRPQDLLNPMSLAGALSFGVKRIKVKTTHVFLLHGRWGIYNPRGIAMAPSTPVGHHPHFMHNLLSATRTSSGATVGAVGCAMLSPQGANGAVQVLAVGVGVDVMTSTQQLQAVPLLAGLPETDARCRKRKLVPLVRPECMLLATDALEAIGGVATDQDTPLPYPREHLRTLRTYIAVSEKLMSLGGELNEQAMLSSVSNSRGRRRQFRGVFASATLSMLVTEAQQTVMATEQHTLGESPPPPAKLAGLLAELQTALSAMTTKRRRIDQLITQQEQASQFPVSTTRSNTVGPIEGKLYSTLSDVPTDSDLTLCQETWIGVPEGWSLAPPTKAVRKVIAEHSWSTEAVLTTGQAFRSAREEYLARPGSRADGKILSKDGQYKPSICTRQILIVQNVTETAAPSTSELHTLRSEVDRLLNDAVNISTRASDAVVQAMQASLVALSKQLVIEMAQGDLDLQSFFKAMLKMQSRGYHVAVVGDAGGYYPVDSAWRTMYLEKRADLSRLVMSATHYPHEIPAVAPKLAPIVYTEPTRLLNRVMREEGVRSLSALEILLRYEPVAVGYFALSSSVNEAFGRNFHDALEHPTTVVWSSWCCGCCGFANEMAGYFYPLRSASLGPALASINAPNCFCSGYPDAIDGALARMQVENPGGTLFKMTTGQPSSSRDYLRLDDNLIWISHADPMGYSMYLPAATRPDYFIGRSMYEFTQIDLSWVHSANDFLVDEVWVPSDWVKDMFIDSGVARSKLRVLPEAIDVHFWDPVAVPHLEIFPPPKWRHSRIGPEKTSPHTKFLSAFKWEARKGWDVLIEAFVKEFSPSDEACLYIITHMWYPGPPASWGSQRDPKMMKEIILNYTSTRLSVPDHHLPCITIITQQLSEADMASAYRSVDAFVLPTRGEGWGLPCQQAMAMGLPTVSTAWGGSTHFMHRNNSLLINVTRVVEIPEDAPYNHEKGKGWAEPSVAHLRSLLRWVVRNPSEARAIGAAAREDMVARFSEEVVSRQLVAMLRDSEQRLLRRKTRRRRAAHESPT